jgi:hypothetical protein
MKAPTSAGSLVLSGALLLTLAACSRGTELEPASSARSLDGDIAYAGAHGIQLLAKGDDWEGDQDILKHATPVYLIINNRGSRPLELQHSRLSLIGPSGHYAALPPLEVERKSDALDWALPEGVALPGRGASGYVYFQRVPRDVGRVTLYLELVDANSGERFGIARIPFQTD